MAYLDDVIEAHGGLARRQAFERVEATVVTTGGLFPLKGLPVAAGLDPGRMLTQLIIHGCYGLGVGVLLQACRRSSKGEPA